MAILQNSILPAAAAAAPADDYTVDNSLKFNDGTHNYIKRTFGTSTNENTWTVSLWAKRAKLGAEQMLFHVGPISGGSDATPLAFTTSDTLAFYDNNDTHPFVTTQVFRDVGSWYHIVMAFSTAESGTDKVKLWVNGSQVTSFSTDNRASVSTSNTVNNSDEAHEFGAQSSSATAMYGGYLADVHFIDGTAKQASDFGKTDDNGQWVPKDFNMSSYSGNSFHLPFSNTGGADVFVDSSGTDAVTTFTDSSSSGHAITANGDVSHTSAEKKVGRTSIKFDDGTFDYLSIPDSEDFNLSGDFTIEFWFNLNSIGTYFNFLSGQSNHNDVIALSSGDFDIRLSNTAYTFSPSSTIATGTWYHFSLVRDSSNNLKAYIDGSLIGTESGVSDAFDPHTGIFISRYYGSDQYLIDGYLDDIRIVKGTAITPDSGGPSSALTAVSGTVLLIHSDGIKHTITTTGTVEHTRAVKKVGGSSIYQANADSAAGSGNYIKLADHSDWDITGDYTFEGWFNIETMATSGEAGGIGFFSVWDSTIDQQFGLLWSAATTPPKFLMYDANGSDTFGESGWDWSPSTDTWYHIAVVITDDGGGTWTTTLYVNGKYINSTNNPSYGSMTGNMYIGSMDEGASYYYRLGGYMDEIRISNSQRYHGTNTSEWGNYLGSSGTVSWDYSSTAPSYDDDSNTLLLIHSDWQGGLGGDASGNANDFAANSLGNEDQMGDTPSAGKGYCVLNNLLPGAGIERTLSEGNLKLTTPSSSHNGTTTGTIALPATGKYYWEIYYEGSSGSDYFLVGICDDSFDTDSYIQDSSAGTSRSYYLGDGTKWSDGSGTSYGNSCSPTDIIGVAVDMDNDAIYFAKNNTWQNSGDPTSGASKTNAAFTDLGSAFSGKSIVPVMGDADFNTALEVVANFGQDPTFNGERSTAPATSEFAYTPPGYGTANEFKSLCTANLPDPTLNNAKSSEKAFEAVTYEATGADSKEVAVSFTPDLVWAKNREATEHHGMVDSVRGAGKVLSTSSADPYMHELDFSSDGFKSFSVTSGTGFTLDDDASGGHFNKTSGEDHVAWCWKADSEKTSEWGGTTSITPSKERYNTTAGISIVAYTGATTGGTYYTDEWGGPWWDRVPHSLGVAPEFILIKNRSGIDTDVDGSADTSKEWAVWHKDLSTNYSLNISDGSAPSNTGLFPVAHDADWFGVANDSDGSTGGYERVNGQDLDTYTGAYNYIAYLFRSVPGYSKCGHYDGTGSTNFQYTDFRPAMLIVKCLDGDNAWILLDSSRDTHNLTRKWLLPNSSDAEPTVGTTGSVDFVSNGFVLRTGDSSTNSSSTNYDYVYYAVAEIPTKFANAR